MRDTYTPLTELSQVRVILEYANNYNLELVVLDVENAFLWSGARENIRGDYRRLSSNRRRETNFGMETFEII